MGCKVLLKSSNKVLLSAYFENKIETESSLSPLIWALPFICWFIGIPLLLIKSKPET